jgi:hypothetical protein
MSETNRGQQKKEVDRPRETATSPRIADRGEAASGFPEPRGKDPGDRRDDPEPHHALNNPVEAPDDSEWPDPYDHREDPREPPPDDALGDEPHTPTGAGSTSEPHPSQDPEADRWEGPKRDKLDS